MKKIKKIKIKKILYIFLCCAFICSLFVVTCFAEDISDGDLDLKLQASNGTVFYFSEARFLNNQTGEQYRADIDPLSQANEHVGFRVNLDGTYNNNTRMCTLKVTRSKNSSSYGRFRLTISANGTNQTPEQGYTYTLPKLNTTRTNNNAFAVGWFDSNDTTKQHIDYIGELPYEFYIVTWFDYGYGAGYIRNLYYEFEWTPSFIYDGGNDFEGEYDDEFEIISTFGDELSNNATIVRNNANVDVLLKSLQFSTDLFNFFYLSLDERHRVLMWVSLALGVVGVTFGLGGAIARAIKK